MKKNILIPLLSLLLVTLVGIPVSTAGPNNKYIVIFNSEKLPKGAEELVISCGGEVIQAMPEVGIIIAESSSASFKADLGNDPNVRYVALDEPRQFISPTKTKIMVEEPAEGPDDPYYDMYQWNMRIINATEDKAWSITTGDPEVKVAILDTGVAYDHPDIATNYDSSLSTYFIDPEEEIAFLKQNPEDAPYIPNVISEDEYDPTLDYHGHGTWCAGAVGAAWNGWGVIGVAPSVTIVNVKVLIAEGWGYWNWIIQGIYYLGLVGVDVGSMSLGGYLDLTIDWCQATYAAFLRVSNFAHRRGVLLVAAAGNEAVDLDMIVFEGVAYPDYIAMPVELPNVMGISGITHIYEFSPISNYGSSAIDVTAPMGYWYKYPEPDWWLDLPFSTHSPHDYMSPGYYFAWMDGTSAACPHVAGVAALVLSVRPEFSPNQVRHVINLGAYDIGDPSFDEYFGHGLVDAYSTVLQALLTYRHYYKWVRPL